MKISNQVVKFSPAFKQGTENKYQNPVDMKAEYLTASIAPVIGGAVVGTGAGILTNYLTKQASKAATKVGNKKLSIAIGAAAGIAIAIVTLLPKLYHTSISGFVKKKEMDVFGRTKSVETNLSEQLDQQASNPDVPLEKNIDNYFKFQMGRKGNGIVVAS